MKICREIVVIRFRLTFITFCALIFSLSHSLARSLTRFPNNFTFNLDKIQWIFYATACVVLGDNTRQQIDLNMRMNSRALVWQPLYNVQERKRVEN